MTDAISSIFIIIVLLIVTVFEFIQVHVQVQIFNYNYSVCGKYHQKYLNTTYLCNTIVSLNLGQFSNCFPFFWWKRKGLDKIYWVWA